MDTNLAAWIFAGGPHIQLRDADREREHLLALRENRRLRRAEHPGLIDRLRGIARPPQPATDLVCCTI